MLELERERLLKSLPRMIPVRTGLAESAVQSVEEMVRVHNLALETRLETLLSVMHFVRP